MYVGQNPALALVKCCDCLFALPFSQRNAVIFGKVSKEATARQRILEKASRRLHVTLNRFP